MQFKCRQDGKGKRQQQTQQQQEPPKWAILKIVAAVTNKPQSANGLRLWSPVWISSGISSGPPLNRFLGCIGVEDWGQLTSNAMRKGLKVILLRSSRQNGAKGGQKKGGELATVDWD